ncbi:hypothetical protein [Campylobacter sp. 19-13652]|uniref:hypothetical protein n=1 Tax=Campylobacter sp. 19-13652 TaxID=2840180 RepID=UPI001C791F5B|nr:hypothetical protein [Campylobacter sp. 19-13652]BCX79776.1 hypothetical protein LBC_12380 [Campylobacter sp. 19-13652]
MNIYELLNSKNILLPKLSAFDISTISKKRTIKAWLGVDTKDFYTLIIIREAKVRLLSKEALEIEDLRQKICLQQGHAIKKMILFYSSQACSKALTLLKQNQWQCVKAEA